MRPLAAFGKPLIRAYHTIRAGARNAVARPYGGHLPPPRQEDDTILIILPRDRRLPGEPWDDYIARLTQSNT